MTFARPIAFAALCGLAFASAVSAQEEEKRIKRSELPPAVEKTVVAQSQGATLRGLAQETENGKTLYEAQFVVDNHTRDVLIDPNGNIVEVEEEVALDKLPTAVKAGLQTKAGKGKITKVETITKHDKLVAYEAKVDTSGKKSEIQVGPDGKALDHKE